MTVTLTDSILNEVLSHLDYKDTETAIKNIEPYLIQGIADGEYDSFETNVKKTTCLNDDKLIETIQGSIKTFEDNEVTSEYTWTESNEI